MRRARRVQCATVQMRSTQRRECFVARIFRFFKRRFILRCQLAFMKSIAGRKRNDILTAQVLFMPSTTRNSRGFITGEYMATAHVQAAEELAGCRWAVRWCVTQKWWWRGRQLLAGVRQVPLTCSVWVCGGRGGGGGCVGWETPPRETPCTATNKELTSTARCPPASTLPTCATVRRGVRARRSAMAARKCVCVRAAVW